MHPIKCASCGGMDFEHDRFKTGLAAFPRTFTNVMSGAILANCSVCLSCGSVAFHVEETALERLRARNAGGKTKVAEL